MIVLDTSAVSAVMTRDPRAMSALAQHPPDQLVLCAPVAAEIRFGLERLEPASRRRRLLAREYQRLRDALEWCDWTEEAARIFGEQKARLQRNGQLIGDMDLVIGSIALALPAAVATFNIRHFARLDGLECHDWTP
ncbi:MAG: type II toxin-antitoxin system VapC family toxin [Myxococcota bacterium]